MEFANGVCKVVQPSQNLTFVSKILRTWYLLHFFTFNFLFYYLRIFNQHLFSRLHFAFRITFQELYIHPRLPSMLQTCEARCYPDSRGAWIMRMPLLLPASPPNRMPVLRRVNTQITMIFTFRWEDEVSCTTQYCSQSMNLFPFGFFFHCIAYKERNTERKNMEKKRN